MIIMNQDRLRRVIDNMHRQGLEQILVTATASVYYLTGVWVEPLERLLALYLDDTGRCVLFGNALFGLEEGDGLTVLTHTDSDDPVAQIAQTVRPGKLGIDKFWASRFLIGLMEQRRDITPVVGSAPVDDARMLKDAQEIEAMVAASRINDQVMAIASAAVKDGATEEELAALVERTFREKGADRSSEGQLVCFGPNGADPHHAPNRTVIARGDTVVFDIFIPIHRYWCDMTRTFFFREASDEGRRVYEAVKAANLAAEALIRPGLPMRDFDRAARKVIEDAGYGPYFTHRLGHGAGLECHEPPDNSSANHTIAQPGMVFSVEPGIYLPGKLGVRIEDLVLVTEDGCRVLNAFSKELTIL